MEKTSTETRTEDKPAGSTGPEDELLIDLAAEPSPRQIVEELDRYIIGQNKAKKSVAIALRNPDCIGTDRGGVCQANHPNNENNLAQMMVRPTCN